MNFFDRARVLILFLQLVRAPQRTDLIFRTINILSRDRTQEPLIAIEKMMLADERFRAMYESHYVPSVPSMDELARLPEDSFGYAFYRHIRDNGLDLDLFPKFHARAPIEYLSLKIYQDHDLWHALLDYGIEIEDELALQAFGIAQFRSPIGALIIAGGLLHLLSRAPLRAVQAISKVSEGYARGQRARFLPAGKLHDFFARPLAEVRRELLVA